jgi:hypothetical protein
MKLKTHQGKHRLLAYVVVLVITLSVVAVCQGVVAKYTKSSQKLETSFSHENYDTPSIDEDLSKVTIGEHNYPVYVRVNVVATWQDKDKKIYYSAPKLGTDYSFTYDTNWKFNEKDGYYYYNTAVAGDTNDISFATDVQQSSTATAPDGYTLHLEVLVETIQAIGKTDDNSKTAVMDAWNIQPDVKEADGNDNES